MKTSIWGPSAWRFLHAITFAFPENPSESEKEAAVALFESLRHLIPCGDCCGHYCSELARDPVQPHVHSRSSLSEWLVALHNKVNARLGKPAYAYEDAAREYLSEDSQCVMPSEPCAVQENELALRQRQVPRPAPRSRSGTGSMGGAVAIIAVCVFALVIWGKKIGRALGKDQVQSVSTLSPSTQVQKSV